MFKSVVLLLIFTVSLPAQGNVTEKEFVVITGRCVVDLPGKNTKKGKKNNEAEYEYVMSPLEVEKDKFPDSLLKKAFEDYLGNKHLLAKVNVGVLKKFKDKSEANKYVREQLKDRARRTYMTENHLERYVQKNTDETDRHKKKPGKEKKRLKK